MRKLLSIILFVSVLPAKAQFTELGLFAGGTHFLGDVGNQHMHLPQGWAGGIAFRYQFNNHYGVRFLGNIGTLANNDASSNWIAKQNRNQQFKSSIWEAGVLLEINFFEFVTGSKKMNHSPYIFAGLAVFGFNPQAQYIDGTWYDLQPLGTEGQGTAQNATGRYGLAGLSLPFGLGYRWSISQNFSVAVETGFRTTSTDYIDDTSGKYANATQLAADRGEVAAYFADRSLTDTDKTGYNRGNSANNDWYVFTGVHLYVALTPKNERCSRF